MTPSAIYAQRRQKLMQLIGKDAVAIVCAYPERVRSKNIKYRFNQDKDFWYLTGFNEPDAVAVIRPGHAQPFVLFSRPKDPYQETSFGARAGIEGCINEYGADTAYPLEELDAILPTLFEQRRRVFIGDELDTHADKWWSWCNQQRRSVPFDTPKCYRSIEPLAGVLHPMRVIKDQHEISLIRHAVSASCSAHRQVIANLKPGVNEGTLSCLFNLELAKHGCLSDPYPNILAGGDRAMCLHYDDNNQALADGELLLIDAGGEYQHYAADITRTYPVNGQFSTEQATLYNLVLAAIDVAIEVARPGTAWNRIYDTAMTVLSKGLLELGIIEGELSDVLSQQKHKPFSVHKTGHWLGLDVHDVGPYQDDAGNWRTLEAGMVFTIEPGLYFAANDERVDAKWRGIGIRIEDDILITETGSENLSANAPRTIEEIESLMA